jgi:hypothetical protein
VVGGRPFWQERETRSYTRYSTLRLRRITGKRAFRRPHCVQQRNNRIPNEKKELRTPIILPPAVRPTCLASQPQYRSPESRVGHWHFLYAARNPARWRCAWRHCAARLYYICFRFECIQFIPRFCRETTDW